VEAFGGECCDQELDRLLALLNRNGHDVVVGMGGGKALDTAKIIADRVDIPVIMVPTVASNDAPCSGCSVVYTATGVFDRVCFQKANPRLVLVDTGLIAHAPARFLKAGMGDALATWFEARSCLKSSAPNVCGGRSTRAALNLSRLCYDTLLTHGRHALAAVSRQRVTPALEHVVEACILLSGLGFESAGLAAAHAIHNGLTALPETHRYLHGEKVALGLLASLHLTGADPDEIHTVTAFCAQTGLPVTLSELGIDPANHEGLERVALAACAPHESIHHEGGEITPKAVVSALLTLDALGGGYRRGADLRP